MGTLREEMKAVIPGTNILSLTRMDGKIIMTKMVMVLTVGISNELVIGIHKTVTQDLVLIRRVHQVKVLLSLIIDDND